MTILTQGTGTIPQGAVESPAFAVPANLKRPGIPLLFTVTFDSQPFPAGLTMAQIGISLDGGLTYRWGGCGFGPGVLFKGVFLPHVMTYSLGANEEPTHAKYSTDAPSAFTVFARVEAT